MKRPRIDASEIRLALHQKAASRAEGEKALLAAIKERLSSLDELRADVTSEHEDLVYRFYHQSYKVYGIQDETLRIVGALRGLAPNLFRNDWFEQIVKEGTGRSFSLDDNKRWLEVTRPMLEAFFHARYFLEMAIQYGRELEEPPQVMPSGWAALLYLYGLR